MKQPIYTLIKENMYTHVQQNIILPVQGHLVILNNTDEPWGLFVKTILMAT